MDYLVSEYRDWYQMRSSAGPHYRVRLSDLVGEIVSVRYLGPHCDMTVTGVLHLGGGAYTIEIDGAHVDINEQAIFEIKPGCGQVISIIEIKVFPDLESPQTPE
jgi:hypothetical protein